MCRLRPIALALASLAACAAHAAPPLTAKLFSLESRGYISTYATDFCGNGLLAGTTLTSDGYYAGYVADRQGGITLYSVPGSTYTEVFACYRSQLMGQTILNGVRSGFYQDSTGTAQLVTPEGGAFPTVEGMNAAGTVVGWYMPSDKDNVRASAFLIKDGNFTRFDLKGRPDTRLIGILEDGTLYGNYMDRIPLRSTGFILRNGVQTDIKVAGSYDTVITGMNQAGQVVGYYSESIGSPYQGFAWQDGRFFSYSFSADGGNTYPKGIDAQGNVVGYVTNPDYSQFGFVARTTRGKR